MAWVVCLPGWGAAAAAGALLLYGTLDVAYFARMMYTVAKARYFKKKACLLDTTEVHSWCLLNDIDTLLYHMNNARYLRELDFARADFYERTGLYANIKAAGGAVVQAAATIRYRRYIKPFTKFTITSKVMEVVTCFHDTIGSYFYERTGLYANIKAAGGAVVQAAATIRYRRYIKPFTKFAITSKAIYWDDKTVFMEHEFVGPGGFVHAVAVCRQRVIDTSAAAIAELLLQLHCAGTCHPPVGKMPPELELWVQSNELSSAKLRGTSMPIGTLPSAQSHAHAGCGEVLPNTGLE